MPNRNIFESSRRSPSLRALTDAAERLFWRLITAVDDFGRFEADPEVVLSACFQRVPQGWNVRKVAGCLHEMAQIPPGADAPLVRLYESGGRQYLQITKSETYFRRRAETSKYPDPQPLDFVGPPSSADNRAHPRAEADNGARIPNSEIRDSKFEIRDSGARPRPPAAARGQSRREALEAFELTLELRAWAKANGIARPEAYLDEFRDYWRGRPDKELRQDWAATFRNRLRYLKAEGKLKAATDLEAWARS